MEARIILLIILMIYWIPSCIYVMVWSVKIRQKHRLTDLDKLGETLVYGMTLFLGLFIIFLLKPKHIKNATLP